MKKEQEKNDFHDFQTILIWNLGWLVGFAITVIYCLS